MQQQPSVPKRRCFLPEVILLLSLLFVLIAQFNHVIISHAGDTVLTSHDPVPDGSDHTPLPNQQATPRPTYSQPVFFPVVSTVLSQDNRIVLPGSRAPPIPAA